MLEVKDFSSQSFSSDTLQGKFYFKQSSNSVPPNVYSNVNVAKLHWTNHKNVSIRLKNNTFNCSNQETDINKHNFKKPNHVTEFNNTTVLETGINIK